MPVAALQQTITDYRARLLAQEAQAQRALETAYQHTLNTLQPKLEQLYRQIGDMQAAGQEIPASWLYEERRLQAITSMIGTQLDQFGTLSQVQAQALQRVGVQLGEQAALAALKASTPDGVAWSFGLPSKQALADLVGATQAGPLADLFSGFGSEAAQNVKNALISGLANGDNPRTIAAQVEQALGVERSRALTISRTEALRSYRSANLQTFQANSDVVDGWVWQADLTTRTCAVCIAMNGTVHSLDEDMPSHVNCRCVQVPQTKSWSDILDGTGIDTSGLDDSSVDMQSGSDWFNNQDEATQRAILGNAKYEAFAKGDITLQDLVGMSHDEQWGASVFERSLQDALKSEPLPIFKQPEPTPASEPFPEGLAAQDAYLRKAQADIINSLTDAEIQAIQGYSEDNSSEINGSLRNPASADQQWAQDIQQLDSALAKSVVPTDMMAYRGFDADSGMREFFKDNIGAVVSDKGFTSTSLDESIAKKFSHFWNNEGAIVEIQIPQGARGLYLSPVSAFDNHEGTIKEYEFLLPRDTQYKVVKYIPETDTEKARFILEVLL